MDSSSIILMDSTLPVKSHPFGLYFTNSRSSDTIRSMGKAGKVLKTVLEAYSISQGKLAVVLGVGRSNVYRWCNEIRDPNSETLIRIVKGLENINPEAAARFKILYLEELGGGESSEK
jgi:hypothetical protein